jgi:L-threonylcarbamoyladenylate synthase
MREKTQILKPKPQALKKAAKIIRIGGLVAFPTETVYGLGANALNAKAVKKIFRAKERPSKNPLIVHITHFDDIQKIAKNIPTFAKKLAEKFWPGPLTLVLEKKKNIPGAVTAGLGTVAIRIPRSPIALRLIKEAGVPIAAPSANKAGKPSAVTAKHVLEDLGGLIDMIIDGGRTPIGLESTVLDLTRKVPTILRPGAITKSQIEKCLKRKILEATNSRGKSASPGMKYGHYAPKAKVVLADTWKTALTEARKIRNQGKKVGILTANHSEVKEDILIFSFGHKNNLKKLASNLFYYLRKADSKKLDVLIVLRVPKRGIGKAIMNRLKKAAETTKRKH